MPPNAPGRFWNSDRCALKAVALGAVCHRTAMLAEASQLGFALPSYRKVIGLGPGI